MLGSGSPAPRHSITQGRGFFSREKCLRIVVIGWIIREPLGGMAWHHLQYVLGLADLGHEVYYLEDSGDRPFCFHPWTETVDTDPTEGLEFARASFDRIGLSDRWAYYDAHTSGWLGPAARKMRAILATADVLLNVAAWVSPMRPWLEQIPVRVFVDTDPAFTQILHLTTPAAKQTALRHNAFFSFGERFGKSGSTIPDDGLPWRPTRQPVLLDAWASLTRDPRPAVDGGFTTVMSWDSYPAREYGGIQYGVKSHSFQPYFDLPRKVAGTFGIAVRRVAKETRDALAEAGWALSSPKATSRDLDAYRDYIRGSKAEFSVAKHGYVITRSGWFSERSAAYLASGRPVLLQDTGFSEFLPAGLGLVAFNDPEEAAAGVEDIAGNYSAHCRAARDVAAEYFDSRKVLARLLDQIPF